MATTSQDITLDTSREHPALTPEMRSMAAELWAIVKARVDEEGFPLRGVVLRAYTDMEEVDWVELDVRCDAPYEETIAFRSRVSPDYARWINQLPEEHRAITSRPGLNFGWLAASRVTRAASRPSRLLPTPQGDAREGELRPRPGAPGDAGAVRHL